MHKIKDVYAREVLDSRGNPTIEVELWVDRANSTVKGSAIVPSGASTGIHEALELRDGDKNRYGGKGVLKAVENVTVTIKNAIVGKEFSGYEELDKFLIDLDGTKNKTELGANAILGVSMAFVVACARAEGKLTFEYLGKDMGRVLPRPMMNIINGGSHADNSVDIQEFMIVPVGAKNIKEAVRMGAEVFHTLKKILKAKGYATSVGDEGGYAPNLKSNEEAFQIIVTAIEEAGYTTKQIKLAIDAAASEFYEDGKYVMKGEGRVLSSSELVEFYKEMVNKYPIISIEDGHDEDDFE